MVSFVYFDVGGVVIRDFSVTGLWDEVKKELGISEERFGEFQEFWKQYKRDICVGRDVDSLLPLISRQFNVTHPQGYSLLKDGFVKRFRKNETIRPALMAAKKKFRIGLLTDMYNGMLAEIKKRQLLPDISWDVIVDSSVVGCKKPDREIFEIAGKLAGVAGREILFVENTEKYVEAARKFGWQAFWYDSLDYEKSSRDLLQFFV